MKKFKALLSVILAAAVLVCSAIPAFAVTEGETATADEETTLETEVEQLRFLVGYVCKYYCPVDGYWASQPYLSYEPTSLNNLLKPTQYAYDCIYKKYDEDKTSVTLEEIQFAYTDLEKALNNLCLSDAEMKRLVEYCSWEENNNNYYPEDLWNKFQSALTEAKTTEFATDKEMTEAFWKLYFTYNELCAVNQTPGDVNFDGKVNVLDATELQLAVAEITTLNSSQRMIAENKVSNEINITAVTNLQFVIAELSEPFNCYQLQRLNDNLYNKGIAPKGNLISYCNREKVRYI